MKHTRLVFIAACLGMLLFGVVMITLGSVLPHISARFSFSSAGTGAMLSMLPIGILSGSLLFGPIADRYGYKALLIICSLFVMIGLEGIAFTTDVPILHVSVFLIGLGGGSLNGATNALVADISTGSKGANLSLLGIFYGLGALGMPVLLSVLNHTLSTEEILSLVGGCILMIVLFFLFVPFPAPKQSKGIPFKEGIKLVQSPSLLAAGFFLFFVSGSEGLINNWTTTYLEKELAINRDNALHALSVLVASLIVGRIGLGKALTILSNRAVLFVFIFLELGASLILANTENYSVFLMGIALFGLGMGANFPIMMGFVAERFAALSGTAFSIILTIALTGNIIINYLMGLIGQFYGIGYFPLAITGCIAMLPIVLYVYLFLSKKESTI